MMANSKNFLSRKRYVRHVIGMFTLACTAWGAVDSSLVFAHGANCNCGQPEWNLASRLSPNNLCDGLCASPCGDSCTSEHGTMSVPVQTRKLSFAEKFLRKMDGVGDRIEANLLPLPRAACTTCGPVGNEVSCGVEIGTPEPSCGLEIPNENCGCSTCYRGNAREARPFAGLRPGYRYRGPAVQNIQSHDHGIEYHYEEEIVEDEVYHQYQDVAPHSKPQTKAAPNSNGSAAPSRPTPAPSKPSVAPQSPKPELTPVPEVKPAPPIKPAPSTVPPPKLEMPPSEDEFTPRQPNSNAPSPSRPEPRPPAPTPSQPVPSPLDALPSQPRTPAPQTVPPARPDSPSLPPTLQLPEVKEPLRLPTPSQPQAPTPLDEMDDILIDPFKDDLSFQHRRNRMNGMEANNRGRIEAQQSSRANISSSSSSRIQAQPRTNFVPATSRISDNQKAVQHASSQEPVVYSQRPQSIPNGAVRSESETIMRLSHQEQVNTTGQAYRSSGYGASPASRVEAPAYQRPQYDGEPRVNRVAPQGRR